MARIRVLLALGLTVRAIVGLHPLIAAAANADGSVVTLQTQVNGNTTWAFLDEHAQTATGDTWTRHVPTHQSRAQCGWWGQWLLTAVNAVTGIRKFGVFLHDGCNGDSQVFPPGPNYCNPDDSAQPSAQYSMCVTLPPRTLIAGLTPQVCNAQAVIATSLNADVTPPTYDSTQPTPLVVTTGFGPQFAERLSEGFCTDVVDWQVMSWTIRWPDGHEDVALGVGQQGITASHIVAPAPAGSPQKVIAIAHLHIQGQALDFDPNAQLIPVTRDAFVDVSNDAAAVGAGVAPVYTPPKLQVQAVAQSQLGNGTIPALDPAVQPAAHATAIRGRLLDLYPRAAVITPGAESVGGVVVGQSVTTTESWRYLGGPTDAPPREATPTGATGSAQQPVSVQYNHAELLNAAGSALDEVVPIEVTAHTVYPDGHAVDTTFTQSVTVSIYYPALMSPG